VAATRGSIAGFTWVWLHDAATLGGADDQKILAVTAAGTGPGRRRLRLLHRRPERRDVGEYRAVTPATPPTAVGPGHPSPPAWITALFRL